MGQVLSFVRDFSAPAHPAVTTSLKFWEDCGVRWMEKCFENQFLNLEVPLIKTEVLSIKKIEQDLLDTQILLELGKHAEISASHYREILDKNRGTEKVFIAYLRGVNKNLCSVSAHWEHCQKNFSVAAHFVTETEGCYAGNMLVSRMHNNEEEK